MHSKPPMTEPPFIKSRSKFKQMGRRKPLVSGGEQKREVGIDGAFACLDNSPQGQIIMRHTRAIADGLDIPLNIIHVMEGTNPERGPSDPIQWQIKHQEAKDFLRRILNEEHQDSTGDDHILLNGIAGDEISRWANDHRGSLIVMRSRCGLPETTGHNSRQHNYLGDAARQLLEGSTASLLLVPPDAPEMISTAYKRLLVPLDGSQRAESVLPLAMRIARKHGAELTLAHVVPEPEIVETGPHDKEAHDLMEHMLRYNEQNARAYLDRLQARLNSDSLVVRTVLESDGDPRERLLALSSRQDADLIVMSAHGRTGMTGMSCGNIARHIATHTRIPLLMIRQQGNLLPNYREVSKYGSDRRIFWESAH